MTFPQLDQGAQAPTGRDPYLILEIDDDPDIARFVEVNLRSAGYDVAVAYDGQEGLEKAFELLPDLILTGVMMPRMDGFELCQRLRADARTQDVIIVILTAKALSTDKALGLSSGADDYLIKPFDPIELLARIKHVLQNFDDMMALQRTLGAVSDPGLQPGS